MSDFCTPIALVVCAKRSQQLDARREQISQEVGDWSRQERFSRFPESICHRFVARRASELEAKGNFFVTQLDDTIFQIEQKQREADKHHDRVVNILFAAVDEASSVLKTSVSSTGINETICHPPSAIMTSISTRDGAIFIPRRTYARWLLNVEFKVWQL